MPSFDDLVSGRVTVSQVRHVELDDLLGRDPVMLDAAGLRGWLAGRVVMVTGAGGSIGAELRRQIARFEPRQLVLFELNEFALYTIEQEFAAAPPAAARGVRDRRRQGSRRGSSRSCAAHGPSVDLPRGGLQARAADGKRERLAGGAEQRRWARMSSGAPRPRARRREVRLHLDRQGGQSDQRDGREQAARRNGVPGAAASRTERASSWCGSATCWAAPAA